MAEKILNSRIIQKHDIAENWLKATNFVPKQGELIIYDRDEDYAYERFKIGDGVALVNDLPFAQQAWQDITNKPFITEESAHGCVIPANAGEDEAYRAKCAYDSNGNRMPFLTHVIPPIGTEAITCAAGNSSFVAFLFETHDTYSVYKTNTDPDLDIPIILTVVYKVGTSFEPWSGSGAYTAPSAGIYLWPDALGDDNDEVVFSISWEQERIDPKVLPDGTPSMEHTLTDTLTFDGNIGDKPYIVLNGTGGFVKISDDVIDSKEFVGGSCTFVSNVADIQSGTVTITVGIIQDSSSLLGVPSYSIGEMVGVVLEDGMFGQTKVTKGTYFVCVPGALYVKELKLPKKVFKNAIYHKLDNRLLDLEWIPTAIQDVIVAPSIISRNGQYELSGKYDPNNISEVEVTWDGVEYICAAEYTPDWFGAGPALSFGNFSFDNGNEEDDTGEPFLIILISDTNGNILAGGMMGEDDDTHIFSVKTKKTYEKLPTQFLPDGGFGYVSNDGIVLPETTLDFQEDTGSSIEAVAVLYGEYKVVDGHEYSINFNGTSYPTIVVYGTNEEDGLSYWRFQSDECPVHVQIIHTSETKGMVFSAGLDYIGKNTISIMEASAIHKIDPKFIPNGFALKSDIPTVPDWAMQENKPFYTADEVGAMSKTAVENLVVQKSQVQIITWEVDD